MRTRRLFGPKDQPSAVYHCISRIVDRRFALGPEEKDFFVDLMRELAEFCEVRILTFCIMSNHFHLLVEVPRPPAELPTTEATLDALSRLSGAQDIPGLRRRLALLRQSGDPQAEEQWLASIHARRWNLSTYMQLLKQRFSSAHNRRTNRKGTLWEERFKSLLVEGSGRALGTAAAYIDLNPVRARMNEDPKDYRWCGYGESVAAHPEARRGLRRVVEALLQTDSVDDAEALAAYRRYLFVEGSEERAKLGPDGKPVRGAIRREAVLAVLANKGQLSTPEYLQCRVRHLTDGVVLGSRSYVEGIYAANPERFARKRSGGPRSVPGLADAELFTLQKLRGAAFS